ncbi:MAG: thiamine pyrophosphate-binding protein [Myxococcaceae bacterium]|nr:thiamine pyrophosphate-binding protein [Myxococcaceae bacterium]
MTALTIHQRTVLQEPLTGLQPEMRVADVIVQTLKELGVDTFYGVPGGAICQVYDALLDAQGVRVVNTRHETGAAFMAMGHAKVGGSLPALLMTSGPGITNALTGLAAAHADGVPLIAIGGEVPKKNFGRGALQEGSRYHLDILGMVRSVTKFSAEISNPRAAATVVRKAVATALAGRQGPVFLSLPLDVSSERVLPMSGSSRVSTHFDLDLDSIERAAWALQRAERPLLLVGSGARHPEAVRWIGTLAATLRIPVATTPRAKGLFPESDPLSLGVFGFGGHPTASRYLEQGIDTLMAVGCGLGETGTNSWSPLLQPSKTFIQVDIDAGQIGKNYQVDFGLVGPSHTVLRELVSRVSRRSTRAPELSGPRYLDAQNLVDDALPLKPARAIAALQTRFPSGTIYTSDIGEHTLFALHYLKVDEPDGFLVSTGLGSMGSGIGAAVGAKLARPERPVVSICGDWGFQMMGMELATCVQNKAGVVFAVFNDARMRMVESGMSKIFGRVGEMDSPRVDFAALARSVGARGLNIRTAAELEAIPEKWLNSDTPLVLDIEIDPASAFPAHGRIAQIKNFAA